MLLAKDEARYGGERVFFNYDTPFLAEKMMLKRLGCCALGLMTLPLWAESRSERLVNAHFEYVKLVHAVAETCVQTANDLAAKPDDESLIIEGMRCYSFLLEKREKLENEVFIPLRRLNFPSGELSKRDEQFVAMTYLIDVHLEEIGSKIEPVVKRHQAKDKQGKAAKAAAKGQGKERK